MTDKRKFKLKQVDAHIKLTVQRVVYRDSKGRYSKFTTKKKLKAIVVFRRKGVDHKTGRFRVIETYAKDVKGSMYVTKLKKWKREKTVKDFNTQIMRNMKKRQKSVLLKMHDSMLTIFYFTSRGKK